MLILLCRAGGQPFYVGKGLGRRALDHEAEARREHPLGESNPSKCTVAGDILKAGLATLRPSNDPRNEIFELDTRQAAMVVGLIGRSALEARGLL